MSIELNPDLLMNFVGASRAMTPVVSDGPHAEKVEKKLEKADYIELRWCFDVLQEEELASRF